ncbi:TolB family protein [Aporhodopirellula aestuarii]|uniref:Translocation protein TolB n=1 Tax=Aporhodopirellula aestuarii TaxID=2950107 RepID=A0ABT0UCR4_9BACT|nr:hypothetical protein [Aporhodopirellula aestuarii]MCM2374260.1 hypothetical protein [Aporhodopirellula aestuarii]
MRRLPCSLYVLILLLIAPPANAEDGSIDVDFLHPHRLLLHYCAEDGTPIRPLVADVSLRHQFDRQGTPEVSADGERVAFDAWTASEDFTWQESRIIVVDIQGENARDISDGVMPSFSPDGTKLVVSRPPKYAKQDGAKGMSIWMMGVDGTNKKMLADRSAWGGRWSPDGRSIVFHGGIDDNGETVPKTCLRLYDVASGKTTNVFSPEESPFSNLSFHFEWSKGDERVVAFGGTLKDGSGSASAVIQVDEGISSLRFLLPPVDGPWVADGASFDWHPSGAAVLVTGISEGRMIPVAVPTDESEPYVLFEGIPDKVVARDPIYTPDGKHLIMSFGPHRQN